MDNISIRHTALEGNSQCAVATPGCPGLVLISTYLNAERSSALDRLVAILRKLHDFDILSHPPPPCPTP